MNGVINLLGDKLSDLAEGLKVVHVDDYLVPQAEVLWVVQELHDQSRLLVRQDRYLVGVLCMFFFDLLLGVLRTFLHLLQLGLFLRQTVLMCLQLYSQILLRTI